MKRRRLNLQLSDEQQMVLAVLLVILVAVSMLYCLGFASLAVREGWENAPLPWNGTDLLEEGLETVPALPLIEPTSPAFTLPQNGDASRFGG